MSKSHSFLGFSRSYFAELNLVAKLGNTQFLSRFNRHLLAKVGTGARNPHLFSCCKRMLSSKNCLALLFPSFRTDDSSTATITTISEVAKTTSSKINPSVQSDQPNLFGKCFLLCQTFLYDDVVGTVSRRFGTVFLIKSAIAFTFSNIVR